VNIDMRKTRKRFGVGALVLFVMVSAVQALADGPDPAWVGTSIPKIDSLFSAVGGPKAPGCALLVMRDGRVVYSRGYGLASVELGIPLRPETVFDIGSVSKQFTAMSVLMLANDGKLSLDDDIRRYVPELRDYGSTIRLRHLLNQTSGLRDYVELFPLAGVAYQTPVGTADALSMLARQKSLNFPPGEAWEYSNTNYMLLGLAVSRVSGQPLDRFLQDRVFSPLGMDHTHVLTKLDEVVPQKASSYNPAPGGGFSVSYYHWETVGDGAIQSTLPDLARWVTNLDEPRVGTPAMVAEMESAGVLNDGSRTRYGMGLILRPYRGLKVFGHNGFAAAFLTDVERFPEARFAVLTSCNCTTMPPGSIFARVADTLLADRLAPMKAPPGRAPDSLEVEWWRHHPGWYFDERSGGTRHLTVQGDHFVVERAGVPLPLRVLEDARLTAAGGQLEIRLAKHGAAEDPAWIDERVVGGPTIRFTAVDSSADSDTTALHQYDGTYSGSELGSGWRVVARGGTLYWKREGLDSEEEALTPLFRDAYSMAFGILRFERDAAKRVQRLRVWTNGVWGLAQQKMAGPKANKES